MDNDPIVLPNSEDDEEFSDEGYNSYFDSDSDDELFFPFPLFFFNSLFFSILNGEEEPEEEEEQEHRIFDGVSFNKDPREIAITNEMLKKVAGGDQFHLSYSPARNAYFLNGEKSEKEFHYRNFNTKLYEDTQADSAYLSSQGTAAIEWAFNLEPIKKLIVGAKLVLKSSVLAAQMTLNWSILVGDQQKWKTLQSMKGIQDPWNNSIDLSHLLVHQNKFKLRVEIRGKGFKKYRLFEEKLTTSGADFPFDIKLWTADKFSSTEQPKDQMEVTDLSHMVNRPEGSDLKLIVGGKMIFAHRETLSKRCAYFDALLSSGMAEAQKGEIQFLDLDHRVMLHVLKFIYSGGKVPDRLLFTFPQHSSGKNAQNRVDITDLLLMASRFNIVPLIERCEKKLIPMVDETTANDLLALATDTNSIQLKAYCEIYLEALKETADAKKHLKRAPKETNEDGAEAEGEGEKEQDIKGKGKGKVKAKGKGKSKMEDAEKSNEAEKEGKEAASTESKQKGKQKVKGSRRNQKGKRKIRDGDEKNNNDDSTSATVPDTKNIFTLTPSNPIKLVQSPETSESSEDKNNDKSPENDVSRSTSTTLSSSSSSTTSSSSSSSSGARDTSTTSSPSPKNDSKRRKIE